MSMFAFFPWLRISSPISVGDVIIVPYSRGRKPAGEGSEFQEKMDTILQPYLESGDRPVMDAAVMQFAGGDSLRDLSEQEIAEALLLGELLTVCGLSSREYFGGGIQYCNRDNFQLVIQRFRDDLKLTGITSRRRDGPTSNLTFREDLRIQKPDHVYPNPSVSIDKLLLEALLRVREDKCWERFSESILWFNLASTDSSLIAEQMEVVMIVSAFERLLDCSKGSADDLAKRFISTLVPTEGYPRNQCQRLSDPKIAERFKDSTFVRDAWVRDFYKLRNDLAHGKIKPKYPAIWSLREHLLLASFVFPLLLKAVLAGEKAYTITPEDQDKIDIFERLACKDLFVSTGETYRSDSWPWNQVTQEILLKRLSETLYKRQD